MSKVRFDEGETPCPGVSAGIRFGGLFRPQAVFHDLIVNFMEVTSVTAL